MDENQVHVPMGLHPGRRMRQRQLRVDSRARLSRRSTAQIDVRRDGPRGWTWAGVHSSRTSRERARRVGTSNTRFAARSTAEELRRDASRLWEDLQDRRVQAYRQGIRLAWGARDL